METDDQNFMLDGDILLEALVRDRVGHRRLRVVGELHLY